MSLPLARIRSALSLGACVGLMLITTACTSMPTGSAPVMHLGQRASAPMGFLDYCQREPAGCAVGRDAAALDQATAGEISHKAGQLFWAAAFDAAGRHGVADSAPASTNPAANRPATVPAAAIAEPPSEPTEVFLAPIQTPLAVEAPQEVLSSSPATVLDEVTVAAAPSSETASSAVPLTPELWRTLGRVNERVNTAIQRMTDKDLYGIDDYWATPMRPEAKAAFGDCEDYVLEKRRALLSAGFALNALSIALVVTPSGESHAVLLVNTDKGEFVLDNLTPWVVTWDKAPYRWRERQIHGAAFDWAYAEGASAR